MTKTVTIDPNVRVEHNMTYSGFEDCNWIICHDDLGQQVRVVEAESGLHGRARIMRIDPEKKIVYLAVPWGSLRSDDKEFLSHEY